jgi:hypothetical protein
MLVPIRIESYISSILARGDVSQVRRQRATVTSKVKVVEQMNLARAKRDEQTGGMHEQAVGRILLP